MRKTILYMLLTAISISYTPVKPPVPTDIPFSYDIEQVKSQVTNWRIMQPGRKYVFIEKAYDHTGESLSYSYSGIEGITVNYLGSVPDPQSDPEDPNGVYDIHSWECNITPSSSQKGVHYVNRKVTDGEGEFDEGTMLILIKDNSPPIFIGCGR